MIYDNIKNCAYYAHEPKFKEAFEFIKNSDNLPLGRHEIGNGVYANIMEFNTIPLTESRIEAHKNYADIQYIARGEETMGFSQSMQGIAEDYIVERDIYFVHAECSYITLNDGDFAIFFPTDYHRPSIGHGGQVRKVVVKVPMK